MAHLPSGTQWLHSRVEVNGYEEYCGTEYRSARCTEAYSVVELVCLRVYPMFTLLHPTESFISFTSIDGSKQEIWPESGEQFYEGNLVPNGEWMLVDKCQGLALVNRLMSRKFSSVSSTGEQGQSIWSSGLKKGQFQSSHLLRFPMNTR